MSETLTALHEEEWPEDPPREHTEGWDCCEGATIPDLIDVSFPTGDAYHWFMLESDGKGLSVEEAAVDEVGQVSKLLQDEVDQAGWVDMMELPWPSEAIITWALENGIAPEQPFLFRFGEPNVYECGGYDGREWDVEYDAELIRIIPWETERVIKAWEDFLADRQRYLDYKAECEARFKAALFTRTDQMYITSTGYAVSGIRYNLCSSYVLEHNLWDCLRGREPFHLRAGCLISGEDPNGSHNEAMKELVKKALEKMPHLTEEQVRGFPKRSV